MTISVFAFGFSAQPAVSSADSLTDTSLLATLKANIDEYEKMMDGNTIYMNMADAYEAYCAACETYYENYYGYEYDDGSVKHTYSADEISQANTTLVNAVAEMTPFTGYVGEATEAADSSYSIDTLAKIGDDYNYYVENQGDDYKSTELYDELSGVLYTYGVGGDAGHYGPSISSSNRLNSANVNTGLLYGSIVFFYTGSEHDEYINTTDTYAVPINLYINANGGYIDNATISFLGIDGRDVNAVMNGDMFILKRDWHGHIEGEGASKYITLYGDEFSSNKGLYVRVFGHDYTSYHGVYYPGTSLDFRSYNASNMYATYYSNTMYYTGTPADETAVGTEVNSYYTRYGLLDYVYLNNSSSSEFSYIRCNSTNISYQQSTILYDAISSGNAGNFFNSVSNNYVDDLATGNAASYIYVVDYDKVLTALEKYKSYYNMYNGGGDGYTYYRQNKNNAMSNLLKAYDTVTSLDPNDPNNFNTSSNDIAGEVEKLASTFEQDVTALESAANALNGNWDTITYSKVPLKQVEYDTETGYSDKYDFTNADGVFCTEYYGSEPAKSTNIMGNYEYIEYYSEPVTAKGTVGEAIYDFTWNMTKHLYDGYEFNEEVTSAYYSASDGGFLNDVETNFDDGNNSDTQTKFTVYPYSQKCTFYAFHVTMDINVNVIYAVNEDGNITPVQTNENAAQIAYYSTTLDFSADDNDEIEIPESFVTATSKYILARGDDGKQETVTTDYDGTYNIDGDKNTITFDWDAALAYSKSSSASTVCNVYVYYKPVEVTVYYKPYSVFYDAQFNDSEDETQRSSHIIGDSDSEDGYVIKFDDDDSSTSNDNYVKETITNSSAWSGATAVCKGANDGTSDSMSYFVGWYLFDHEVVTYEDFVNSKCISTAASYHDNQDLLDLASEYGLNELHSDINNWNSDTTYYFYAVFTEDPILSGALEVDIQPSNSDESDESEFTIPNGSPFVIRIEGIEESSQTEHIDMSVVGYVNESGKITVNFALREGHYNVTVESVDGYTVEASDDYSDKIVSYDNEETVCTFTVTEANRYGSIQNASDGRDNVFTVSDITET